MWINLLSVCIGGVLAIMGGVATQIYQHFRTARSVESGLYAEISAILEIIKVREYVPFIEGFIVRCKSSGEAFPIVVPVSRRYLFVYENNADKIGYLKPALAADVARFYALINSVIEDVKEPPPGVNARNRTCQEWEQTLALLKQAITLGNAITKDSGAIKIG